MIIGWSSSLEKKQQLNALRLKKADTLDAPSISVASGGHPWVRLSDWPHNKEKCAYYGDTHCICYHVCAILCLSCVTVCILATATPLHLALKEQLLAFSKQPFFCLFVYMLRKHLHFTGGEREFWTCIYVCLLLLLFFIQKNGHTLFGFFKPIFTLLSFYHAYQNSLWKSCFYMQSNSFRKLHLINRKKPNNIFTMYACMMRCCAFFLVKLSLFLYLLQTSLPCLSSMLLFYLWNKKISCWSRYRDTLP